MPGLAGLQERWAGSQETLGTKHCITTVEGGCIFGPTPGHNGHYLQGLKFPGLLPLPSSAASSWPGVAPRAPAALNFLGSTPQARCPAPALKSRWRSPPSSAMLLPGEKGPLSPAMVIYREWKENKGEELALRNDLESRSWDRGGRRGRRHRAAGHTGVSTE